MIKQLAVLYANVESRSGVGRGTLALFLAAVALFAGSGIGPVFAQGWTPTVATAPGGSFNAPPPPEGGLSVDIDQRYFPSPHDTAPKARQSVPQGAWSPIVTGALPDEGEPRPVQRAPLRKVQGAVVAPLQSLSPIRPTAQAQPGATNKAIPAKAGAAGAPARIDATEATQRPGPFDSLPPNASAAQQYCFNTADSASDARFAWQAKKIKEMEAELDKRAQQLEAKTAEYKTWLERRDEFARKAHEKLVGFYSGMRPDAAAGQLAELDEEMAAAVVIKLQTKVASQIMGEMDPERAAKIATIISGAGKIPPNRRRPEPATAAPAAGAPTAEGPRS